MGQGWITGGTAKQVSGVRIARRLDLDLCRNPKCPRHRIFLCGT